MPERDSTDKIVSSYFAAVTKVPFTFRGKSYEVEPLRVSPLLFRGFTCPPNCGGCCPTFTLDYLPEPLEDHPYPLTRRDLDFDGRVVTVWSDMQEDNKTSRCHNLNHEDGRCGIHGRQPFSCDFELTRVIHQAGRGWNLLTKSFGRSWAMKRTGDGKPGALCEILPITKESTEDVLRKLHRLETWATHFGLQTKLPEVFSWWDSLPNEIDMNYPERYAATL